MHLVYQTLKVNKMSKDDRTNDEKGKIFVLRSDKDKDKDGIIDDTDDKELTPRVAAYRLCRSIQNIYLEISSQQDIDLGNSYEEVQKSFILREYGEMFMLRNIEDFVILDIYNSVNKRKDWNEVVLPLNWGYITFQEDPKISFHLFCLWYYKKLSFLQMKRSIRILFPNQTWISFFRFNTIRNTIFFVKRYFTNRSNIS